MSGSRIRTYDPRISVVLKKNVRRDFMAGSDGLGGNVPASARFRGVERNINLTPFLGEAGGVRVSKNIRQPAGSFNITLADRMFEGDTAQMESLYGLIEPMDMIEIRMAHDPSQYRTLPIVMRGFVSSVSRTQVMGSDGRPQRAIQIAGQDYGKLWQIIQIRYFANYVMGQQLLTFLRFAQNYGVNSNLEFTPNQFMAEVTKNVINGFIDTMRRGQDGEDDPVSPVQPINTFDLTVSEGEISPFGVNAWQGGTVYQLMAFYGDVGPWNELFIEDREAGPALVYRPNPFKTPAGQFIQEPGDLYQPEGGTADGAGIRTISLTDQDLVADNTGRSDADLANYYWVDAPAYNLVRMDMLRLQAANERPEEFFLSDYRNCAPWLYGIRIMETQTRQGARLDGLPEDALLQNRGDVIAWLDQRRRVLVESSRDNVVFENGAMTLRGNERLKPGSYLRMQRGSLTSEYYVPQVDHIYMPFRSFTTTVQVERGTGFIARAQRGRGKQSPYLAETNAGGVYE